MCPDESLSTGSAHGSVMIAKAFPLGKALDVYSMNLLEAWIETIHHKAECCVRQHRSDAVGYNLTSWLNWFYRYLCSIFSQLYL